MIMTVTCRAALRAILPALLLALCSASAALGQGNVFDHVRYNGGTFYTKVSPKDWGNTLTIGPDRIIFKLKDHQQVEVETKLVTSLSYGEEAHNRVGLVHGVVMAPFNLLHIHKNRDLYYIGFQYNTPDGVRAGLLLQGDKDNYRAILQALQTVTNLPIAVSEDDRQYVPMGLKITINSQPSTVAVGPSGEKVAQYGSLDVTSDPPGADVIVDGAFVGNSPATFDLRVGKHTITISSQGYKDWSKVVEVLLGSKVEIAATLQKL